MGWRMNRFRTLVGLQAGRTDLRGASTARAPPRPPRSLPGRSSDKGPCVNYPPDGRDGPDKLLDGLVVLHGRLTVALEQGTKGLSPSQGGVCYRHGTVRSHSDRRRRAMGPSVAFAPWPPSRHDRMLLLPSLEALLERAHETCGLAEVHENGALGRPRRCPDINPQGGGSGVTVSTCAKGAHSRPWIPMDAHFTSCKSLLCVQRGSVYAHREGPLPTSPHRAGTHKQGETQAGDPRGRPPLAHHGWQAGEHRRIRRWHGRPQEGSANEK